MERYPNDKIATFLQKRDQRHDLQVPKNKQLDNQLTHYYDPLGNISCKIGDSACAVKHSTAIQKKTLNHSTNRCQKSRSLLGLQQKYGNRFVQRIFAQQAIYAASARGGSN
jgi:hypothetical protein